MRNTSQETRTVLKLMSSLQHWICGCVHDSGCVFLFTHSYVVCKVKHFLHRQLVFQCFPYLARVDFAVNSSTRLPWARNSQLDCKSLADRWSNMIAAERKRLFNCSKRCLVGSLEHGFIFPYIGNFIIPTEELIFFRGIETTNQLPLAISMWFPLKWGTSWYLKKIIQFVRPWLSIESHGDLGYHFRKPPCMLSIHCKDSPKRVQTAETVTIGGCGECLAGGSSK